MAISTIGTNSIENGAVVTTDLADGAVTSVKVNSTQIQTLATSTTYQVNYLIVAGGGSGGGANSYGAAGAIVLLLTWVFYTSQIIFFGAEFTHALAAEHGILLDSNAIAPTADEGMKHTHALSDK